MITTRPPMPLPDDDEMRPCVPFVPYVCPHCGRYKPHTEKTRGRLRYHTCLHCRRKYKSYEVSPDSVEQWIPPAEREPPPPEN